jgi:hypothetical protein
MNNSYTDTTKSYLKIGAIVAALGIGIHSGSYIDYPGYTKVTNSGRTKNSVATLVTSAIAQQMYPNQSATIDVNVKKPFFANSRITGKQTPYEIHTQTDLILAHNDLNANIIGGQLQGLIAKSEFDWQIKQESKTHYHVSRANFKFDTDLALEAKNGIITGRYNHPTALDWKINGTYTTDGKINVNIDVPFSTANMTLDGKIVRN